MSKTYTSITTGRTPRPRSKRLREQGVGTVSSSIVINSKGGGGGSGSGGGSSSPAISDTEVQRIVNTYGSTLFLSKVSADEAAGHITMNQGETVNGPANLNGSTVIGQNGSLTANGSSTFNGNSTFNGDVGFNGDVTAEGDVTVTEDGTLTVAGPSEFDGVADFDSNVNISNHSVLDVDGDTDLSGALKTTHGITPYATLLARMLLGTNGAHGFIGSDGTAELETLLVNSIAKLTQGVFRDLVSAKHNSSAIEAQFEDGFDGKGMRLWRNGDRGWSMTLDTLTVRKTMYVFELVIQKIRSVGGILLVSAADGKIDTVQTVYATIDNHYVPFYLITFEDTNTFMEHDLMRCQRWRGGRYNGSSVEIDVTYEGGSSTIDTSSTMKYYWVEVDYNQNTDDLPTIYDSEENILTLDDKSILVRCDRFEDSVEDPTTHVVYELNNIPEAGDECVLMGNTTDTTRQNYIMISAAEDGVPRIDIKTGCDSPENTGDLRTRLGCLDGIIDDYWRGTVQPHGYGLYSDNAWLKGTFVVRINGVDTDVASQLELTQEHLQTTFRALRQDLIGEEGHISNNMFHDGLAKWYYYEGGDIYTVQQGNDGTLLSGNSSVLVSSGGTDYAKLVSDERIGWGDVLEIRASSAANARGIYQRKSDMRGVPTDYGTDPDTGDLIEKSFMLTLYYYAYENSTLTVELGTNSNTDTLTPSTGSSTFQDYRKLTVSFMWDGQGDLAIYGYGHFRIYGIVLTENVDEELLDQYVSQIEQTAQSIQASVTGYVYNPQTEQYETVGFSTFAQYWNAFSSTVKNNMTSTESAIEQTAETIALGVTQRNGNGNRYLQNPTFNGFTGWTRSNSDRITRVVGDGMVTVDLDAASGQTLTLTQTNANFAEKPTLYEDAEGNTQPYPIFVELWLDMVTSAAVLFRLAGTQIGSVSSAAAGQGFKHYVFYKTWDTTGDFSIQVNGGHVRIYGLAMNGDVDSITQAKITIERNKILAEVEDEYLPASGFDEKLKTSSALSLNLTFSSLSTSVSTMSGQLVNKAEISTSVQYDPATHKVVSNITLSADKIALEGYTTINDGFSVDEAGNARMNNCTIAGVLNNLIQQKTFLSAGEQWDFNPLEWGGVIEWTPYGNSDTHLLVLPCAYASNSNGHMTVSSTTGMTMRDLRQCVGKKFTFLCTAPSLNAGIIIQSGDAGNGFLMLRQDYDGNDELDLGDISNGDNVTPSTQLTRLYQVSGNSGKILGAYYFTAECKMGMYNGFECIYWEIYKSAQRGEVAYTVNGTVTVGGSAEPGAVVEFIRIGDSAEFRTVTDRRGNYAIALFADDYTIKVYADSSSQAAIYTEDEYTVSTFQTKNITVTT